MAEENTTPAAEEAPSGSKKKLIILVVGALALVGAGVGGTVFFLGGGNEQTSAEVVVEEASADPIYIALDPTFVVNFKDAKQQNRFLKAELNVLTFDEDVEKAVSKHMPLIRNNLVMLFNRQVFEDLLLNEGKDVLRAEALAQVQSVIEKHLGKPGIEDLYFTTFVMQ